MDDLVERAEARARWTNLGVSDGDLFRELAAEIRSLREQVAQAELDFADLKSWAQDIAASAAAEIRSLREQVAIARLEGGEIAREAAAEAVNGYIHPDWQRLPGEAFASAQVRALDLPAILAEHTRAKAMDSEPPVG
jgi:hypothetical protein